MAVATCKHSATRNEEEISKLEDFFSPDNIEWPRAPIETQHTDPSSAATSIQEERVERTALTAATQPHPHRGVPSTQPHPPTSTTQPSPPTLVTQHSPTLLHSKAKTRFGQPISEEQLQSVIEKRVPHNTKKTATWGLRLLEEWSRIRSITKKIEEMDTSEMTNYLAKFIQKARRNDSQEYPAATLHNIVSAIQRHLKEIGRPEISFFADKSPTFDLLRKSLDARMKELMSKGVGHFWKQAQPITPGMVGILWEKGIFSQETGQGLLNTVFWYGCKMFGLRGGDEPCRLGAEQL